MRIVRVRSWREAAPVAGDAGGEGASIAGWRQNAGSPVSELNGGNRVKKVLDPIRKLFKQAKENPIIAIGVAMIAVLLIAGVIVLAVVDGGGGGDDESKTTAEKSSKGSEGGTKDPAIEKAKKRKVKAAPVVTGAGTLDTARSIGTFALAQGRGLVKNPSSISVRVSAAPKQKITVDYELACYRESGTKISKGRYRTRPPDIRTVPLPFPGAKQCAVTVGAQLTSHRPGRVKVAIIAG
jgi:hypothetical protein